MISKEVTVSGVSKHDNPMAELVQVACHFESEISLSCGSKKINAKSIMGIMAFGLDTGMQVNVIANGKDEGEALEAMEAFLAC